jgi:hypothetical protein
VKVLSKSFHEPNIAEPSLVAVLFPRTPPEVTTRFSRSRPRAAKTETELSQSHHRPERFGVVWLTAAIAIATKPQRLRATVISPTTCVSSIDRVPTTELLPVDRTLTPLPLTRLRRLALVTDAWSPQTNGVVNTLVRLVKSLELAGTEVLVVAPDAHRTVPLLSYPEIRIACDPWKAIPRICAFEPDAVHVATEGPLGFWTVGWLRRQGLRSCLYLVLVLVLRVLRGRSTSTSTSTSTR